MTCPWSACECTSESGAMSFEDEGIFAKKKYREYQPVSRFEDDDDILGGATADTSLQMPRQQYVPPEGGEDRPWRDVAFAVVFIVFSIIGMLVCIGILSIESGKHPETAWTNKLTAQNFTLVVLVSIASGIIYAAVFFYVLRFAATFVIYVCLFATTGFFLFAAFLCLCTAKWLAMCFFLVCFVCALIYAAWAQRRVPFAACILEVAMEAIHAHPYIILVSYAFFIPEAVTAMIYTSAFYMLLSPQVSWFWQVVFMGLLTVVFFWSTEVSKNVIRTMVSGTVGTWYFYEGSTSLVPYRPTVKALQRACTTSFGSIAFGSLVVAFIQSLRAFVRLFRRTKCACIVACVDWTINIIDGFVQYFNKYAYTYVAIYGLSFLESSKETWHLLRDRGFDVIVNDSLIEGVLRFGAILFAGLCGGSLGMIALICSNPQWLLIMMSSTSVCFIMIRLATEAVDGAVATLFVCFAENANAMAQTKPELYGRLVSAWRRRWGEVPSHVAMVANEGYKAPHPSEVVSGSDNFLPQDLM